MKFFLISNMYPTPEYPGYGSFVKNVCDGLVSLCECSISGKAVIKGKPKGRINKIIKYLCFYLSIIRGFFKSYDEKQSCGALEPLSADYQRQRR